MYDRRTTYYTHPYRIVVEQMVEGESANKARFNLHHIRPVYIPSRAYEIEFLHYFFLLLLSLNFSVAIRTDTHPTDVGNTFRMQSWCAFTLIEMNLLLEIAHSTPPPTRSLGWQWHISTSFIWMQCGQTFRNRKQHQQQRNFQINANKLMKIHFHSKSENKKKKMFRIGWRKRFYAKNRRFEYIVTGTVVPVWLNSIMPL